MSEILNNTGVKLWSETDYSELWLTVFDQLTGQGGKSNIRLIDEAIGKINAALDGYKFEFSSDEDRLYISKGDSKLPVSLIDSNGHVASKVDGTTITIDESGVVKGIPVDDALSEESTNPLQNKVIAGELKSIKSKMGTNESVIKQNTSDITSNTKRIEANETAISTLNGTGDGSVKKAVSDGIAEVVAGAPEDFDTLKEMSDWISTHETSASAMNSQIQDNKKAITTLQTDKADKTEIPTELPANGGNADTVNGHTVKSDVPENAVFTDTTYSDATQIEHGLMSVDDKKKLDGLTKYTPDGTTITADEDGTLHGVAKVIVDTALSPTSTNPVQNKVVTSNLTDLKKETTVNLLNPTLQTTTLNGVTCTNNGDGTYTFKGTATSTARFEFGIDDNLIAGKTYKVLGIPIDGSFSTVLMGWDDYGYFNKEGTVYEKISDPKPISMQVISGYTCDNLVFKPMLTTNLSATYDDFVPYTGDTGKLNGDVAELKAEIVNNKTVVDATMSDTSTNPVQNKVVNAAIVKKADTISYDKMTGTLYLKSGSTVLSSAEIKSLPPGLKIVTFANGTDEEIAKMIQAHYDNKINIADYWAVGDTRTVSLSAMVATGVGESHRAQTVKFVIGDFDHDDLTTPINGHTKAAVTLLQKDCLMDASDSGSGKNSTEKGYMNKSGTNENGWKGCARRTWCNNVYFKALPTTWQSMVKTVNKKTSIGYMQSDLETVQDKIFLASEIEIFGSIDCSFVGEGTQYQYYKKATANRYKMPKWTNFYDSNIYFERSPFNKNNYSFCCVGGDGTPGANAAYDGIGIAPCLCI